MRLSTVKHCLTYNILHYAAWSSQFGSELMLLEDAVDKQDHIWH